MYCGLALLQENQLNDNVDREQYDQREFGHITEETWHLDTALLCDCLDKEVGSFFDYQRPEGGLFVWAKLPDGVDMLEFVKKANFLKVHVFPYSERTGTAAAQMPQLPIPLREERAKILGSLEKEIGDIFERSFIGKEAEVLFEQTDENYTEGLTKNYLRVYIKRDSALNGSVCKVKITEKKSGRLFVSHL